MNKAKEKVYYSNIQEISDPIRQQQLSPTEIVDQCLERITQLNPELNAFITVMADEARQQAGIAESEIKDGKWRGPLHGVPMGIKDFYDTAGTKTTAAVEQFKDRVSVKDAAAVRQLKQAGAIIIGKMNMHELGMGTTGLASYYGPVKNPWNAEHIPGGSSSGSAAAVASGLCYATLDTDAIGSTRLPAACCGVVGFKGTYGLIDTQGILDGEAPPDEMIVWLNHAGITTRSVTDTALVLNAVMVRNEQSPQGEFSNGLTQHGTIRIGVADNFHADQVVAAAFSKAAEIIRGFEYPMREVHVPFGDPDGGIANIEADRKAIAGQAFKDIEILLLPTTATTVPTVRDAGTNAQALSPDNTAFANYYGLPAISVPCGFDSNGLPLGVQFVGKPRDDMTVLRLANQFQVATEYGRMHPTP